MSLSRHFRILIQEAAVRIEDGENGKSIEFGARGPGLEASYKGIATFLHQTKFRISEIGLGGRVFS